MHIFKVIDGIVTQTWEIIIPKKGDKQDPVNLETISDNDPFSDIREGTATIAQVLYNGKFVDVLAFYSIIDARVTHIWESGSPDFIKITYPDLDIRIGSAIKGQIEIDGEIVDPVPLHEVIDKTVTRKWESGKSLEMLKKVFPGADIRYGNAVCGQIENADGSFSDPPPRVKSSDELKSETIKAALTQDVRDDLLLAWARNNPDLIPEDIKPQVQEALDA